MRLFATILTGLFLLPTAIHAQDTFWGLTSNGGQSNAGTLYTMTSAGVFTKKYDFVRIDGQDIRCDMIKASNGKYYGVTIGGGSSGDGNLFSYDPATGLYTALASMSTATGTSPDRGLVQASNGLLYGVCRAGGTSGLGTIFEFNIATGVLTNRFSFAGINGSTPCGRMVQAANGKLYGVTELGGTNSVGCIFEFNPTGNVYAKRFNLVAASGSGPGSGLVVASNGLLYGTTKGGGANSLGTIFTFNSTTFAYTKLVDMAAATGSVPNGELVQASNGKLYGTTTAGGANGVGALFSYDITGVAYAKLVDLATATGSVPYGRMIQASNGLLYGMTSQGGTNNKGVIYSLDATSSAYTVVDQLDAHAASTPYAGLLEDPVGRLVGTVNAGGGTNGGSVFAFTIVSSAYTELAAMGYSDGAYPLGSMTRAANGLFYGLTQGGGTLGGGVLFSYNTTTNVYTRLVDLGGVKGKYPNGKMALVGNVLYGLCYLGGANASGTLFSYDIASNTYTVKVDLQTSTGIRPLAGLMLASNGKLYGTCSEGGTYGYGTIFDYVPGAVSLTVRQHVRPIDGTTPIADLVQASDGMLYGTLTEYGSYGGGAIYKIDPTTNAFTRVYDLQLTLGTAPGGVLVESSPGKLHGIAREGGLNSNGVIYSYVFGTGVFTDEHDLTTAEGNASEAGMVQGTNGKLYGTCVTGGTFGFGTVFQYDPTTLVFTNLRSLATADGIYPYDGLAKETIPASTSIQLNAKVFLDRALNTGTGLMTDALRVLASFPLTEPYTALGFTQVGGGGEAIAASVLTVTGNNAIVDWVLVELRSKTNSSTILATRCGLLQRDGDIVDVDGTSPLSFQMPADDYFVAVRHRNHLGVCTLAIVTLSASPATVDFTTGALAVYGTNAQNVNGIYRTSWSGNALRDAVIKYTGSSNDRDVILVRIGGTVPSSTAAGYLPEDVNLDGVVKYTGSNNDRDVILTTIGGTVPSATRAQQLP